MLRTKLTDSLLFARKFLTRPAVNGSLVPSSSVACRSMLRDIDFSKIKTIVELGPGLGGFTKEYLAKVEPDTRIILFEVDPDYRRHLGKLHGGNLILAEDATAMEQVMQENGIDHVDLIVSSLPMTLGSTLQVILKQVKAQTDQGTIFRTYTYLPFAMKKHYRQLPMRRNGFVFRNLPPMWIYGVN